MVKIRYRHQKIVVPQDWKTDETQYDTQRQCPVFDKSDDGIHGVT